MVIPVGITQDAIEHFAIANLSTGVRSQVGGFVPDNGGDVVASKTLFVVGEIFIWDDDEWDLPELAIAEL
jgi:hypothetical protein